MPRYFFHLHNDVEARDEEGIELADLEAARQLAFQNVRFTAGETIKEKGRIVLDHRIDIEDDKGNVLDTVRFRDAVAVEG
jgi:hypothetical protein